MKLGFTELHVSPVDRRKKDIVITTSGRAVYEALQAQITQFELALVDGFSAEELATAQRVLKTVRARLVEKE